jgi:hypothetical protein
MTQERKRQKKKKKGKQKNESEEKIKTIDDERFNDLFKDPDFAHDEEEASRVRKRQKIDKKKKEAAEIQVHALQTGQTISYKDSDLHIKPSELAKEKKKTLAERIAENSKQKKNYSISNLRGNKEMVYKDASEEESSSYD